ncbi:hypothetical protein ACMYSQ_005368 [Aspergillus niger]
MSWTHLIRFIAVEDSQTHLGQLVDPTRDVGEDSVNGVDIAAYLINGDIFNGRVTSQIMHVKQACPIPYSPFHLLLVNTKNSSSLPSPLPYAATSAAWASTTPTTPKKQTSPFPLRQQSSRSPGRP